MITREVEEDAFSAATRRRWPRPAETRDCQPRDVSLAQCANLARHPEVLAEARASKGDGLD